MEDNRPVKTFSEWLKDQGSWKVRWWLVRYLAKQRGKRARRNLWLRAFVFGIVVTVACLVLFSLLWHVWVDDPSSTYTDSFTLQLAFRSAVATFFTVFLAGALGYFAVMEYAETHQSPQIILSLSQDELDPYSVSSDGRTSVVDRSLKSVANDGLDIWIKNSTNVFSSWYVVEIQLPHDLALKATVGGSIESTLNDLVS